MMTKIDHNNLLAILCYLYVCMYVCVLVRNWFQTFKWNVYIDIYIYRGQISIAFLLYFPSDFRLDAQF